MPNATGVSGAACAETLYLRDPTPKKAIFDSERQSVHLRYRHRATEDELIGDRAVCVIGGDIGEPTDAGSTKPT